MLKLHEIEVAGLHPPEALLDPGDDIVAGKDMGTALAPRSRRCPDQTPAFACQIVAGLDSSAYGTRSIRRTKPAQIYKKTGNLRAVQLLLGHAKLESTVRCLGIEVDDALAISEQIEL
jgi:hypothetical protein